MNKLAYLIHLAKRPDYKKVFKLAKTISKESGKAYPAIVSDMFYCAARYKVAFNHYREFDYYLLNKRQRRTYLSIATANEIVRRYNDKEGCLKFDDKGLVNSLYSEFIKREWLDLRKSSLDEFAAFAEKHGRFIVKPISGFGGKGIEVVDASAAESCEKLYEHLLANDQALAEELIEQHPDVSRLYSGSVNSFRMFTFYADGRGHHLQTVLKLGNNGSVVDNFSSGGMYTFVDREGRIRFPAIDGENRVFEKHPVSGVELTGYELPYVNEAIEMVEKAACVLPEVRYVGWDVAIGVDGPEIIEGNEYPGIYEPKGRFVNGADGILTEYRKYMDI